MSVDPLLGRFAAEDRQGDASTPLARDPKWHFDYEREPNAEEDRSILPVLERLGMAPDPDGS